MRMVDGKKIIYPELSYLINGILFEAHNTIGRYTNEQQICDFLEQKFIECGLPYEREKALPPLFTGEQPGRHRVDFFIDGKIILEIKYKPYFSKSDYFQTKRYLNVLNKKLAILVNFKEYRLHPKRILNSESKI